MEKKQVVNKNSRMEMRKSHLKSAYLLAGVVLLVLILFLYFTSDYYASTYPYSNISQLPRTATTVVLSIFNGYTEKIPLNYNATQIIHNVNNIRQEAASSVNTTIEELILAFALLMFFSVFNIIFSKEPTQNRHRKYEYLPIIFLASLIISQYIVFLSDFLRGGSASGISLFFVDSLAIIIWFGVFDEFFIIKSIRKAGAVLHLKWRHMKLIMVLLAILLPLIVILMLYGLLTNLGLFSYNSSFIGTYFAHFSGLVEFVLLFAILFYWSEIIVLIEKARRRLLALS